jgi:hypothetical protein
MFYIVLTEINLNLNLNLLATITAVVVVVLEVPVVRVVDHVLSAWVGWIVFHYAARSNTVVVMHEVNKELAGVTDRHRDDIVNVPLPCLEKVLVNYGHS